MGSVSVRTKLHDGVALVIFDAPPVNALSSALRQSLWDLFGKLRGQPAVKAVALVAEGEIFSAGADLTEFASPPSGPALPDLCNRIEAMPVPVVACLQGKALGGGAELALACHYRIALKDAQIGFPEITLGLIPGAGGTQRLPRLAGAEAALDLILGGRPVDAARAQSLHLVDGVVEGHLPSAGVHFAKMLLQQGKGPRPTRSRREGLADGQAFLAAVEKRRAALKSVRLAAPGQALEAVEAALLLPYDAGQALESDHFATLLAGDQSRALRHLFLAERRIAPTLLSRGPNGSRQVTEAGAAVVDRLRAALRVSVDHVAGLGVAPARIDAALLQFGFLETPFGFTDPSGIGRDTVLIQRRIVSAMMAEGARLVERQQAARPSDIDVLAVHGLGFPRIRGGPMQAATAMGLVDLRRDMARWAEESRIWSAPRLLDEAVKYADGFEAVPEALFSPE